MSINILLIHQDSISNWKNPQVWVMDVKEDVTLAYKDDQEVGAHKVILTSMWKNFNVGKLSKRPRDWKFTSEELMGRII